MFPYVSYQQVIEALLEKVSWFNWIYFWVVLEYIILSCLLKNDSDALSQLKELNKLLLEHGIDRASKFHYYGMFLLATQQVCIVHMVELLLFY